MRERHAGALQIRAHVGDQFPGAGQGAVGGHTLGGRLQKAQGLCLHRPGGEALFRLGIGALGFGQRRARALRALLAGGDVGLERFQPALALRQLTGVVAAHVLQKPLAGVGAAGF